MEDTQGWSFLEPEVIHIVTGKKVNRSLTQTTYVLECFLSGKVKSDLVRLGVHFSGKCKWNLAKVHSETIRS